MLKRKTIVIVLFMEIGRETNLPDSSTKREQVVGLMRFCGIFFLSFGFPFDYVNRRQSAWERQQSITFLDNRLSENWLTVKSRLCVWVALAFVVSLYFVS